jgi:hypothetical protein
MADYYRLVSFILPLTTEQQAWADADLVRRKSYHGDEKTERNCHPNIYIERRPDHWWINGHVGNLEALTDWLQSIMRQFNIADAWTLAVSFDCTTPRLDAYGGFAAIITRNGVESMSTGQWIEERLAARALMTS